MNTIQALHHQRDELVAILKNDSDKMFWDDEYVREIDGEYTCKFTMPANIKEAEHFERRSRFLILNDEGGLEEFIIYETITINNEKTVYGIASVSDIEKSYLVSPGTYTGNIKELLDEVLPYTHWSAGTVEYAGTASVEVDKEVGAFTFINMVRRAFSVEFDYRIAASGNKIKGRYIESFKRIGQDRGKEIVSGKDLMVIEKKVYSERIVTALMVIGPEREDGTRVRVWVENQDAYQRWNVKGMHIVQSYEPEVSDQNITQAELVALGDNELEKRITSAIEYKVTAAALAEIYPHEKTHLGDEVDIKDYDFSPPFFAQARVIRVDKIPSDESAIDYTIGEVTTYSTKDLNKTLNTFKKLFDSKVATKNSVVHSFTKPPIENAVEGDVFINAAEDNRIEIFDAGLGDYSVKKLGETALSVTSLSAINSYLGTVYGGDIYGARVLASTLGSVTDETDPIQINLLIEKGIGYSRDEDLNGTIWTPYTLGLVEDHDIPVDELKKLFINHNPATGKVMIGAEKRAPVYSDPHLLGGEVEMNITPNFNYEMVVKNGIRHENGHIVTTQVETSEFGLGGYGPSGITSSIVGQRVKFTTKKTYVPATISRMPVSTNVAGVSITRITEDGFWVFIEGDGVAGYKYYDGEYSA